MPIYDMIGNELSVGDICCSTSDRDYKSTSRTMRFGLIYHISEPKLCSSLDELDKGKFNRYIGMHERGDDSKFYSIGIVHVSNLPPQSILNSFAPDDLDKDILSVDEKFVSESTPVCYSLFKIDLPHYYILSPRMRKLLEIQSDISCGIKRWEWLDNAERFRDLARSFTKMFD